MVLTSTRGREACQKKLKASITKASHQNWVPKNTPINTTAVKNEAARTTDMRRARWSAIHAHTRGATMRVSIRSAIRVPISCGL